MVGLRETAAKGALSRGFPTDLPMVGQCRARQSLSGGRGFPTDLPMVGQLCGKRLEML